MNLSTRKLTFPPRHLRAIILWLPCLLLTSCAGVGTWRVDIEKTVQANRTAPATFTRNNPTWNWESVLRSRYAGIEYRMSPNLMRSMWDPYKFDGRFVAHEHGNKYAHSQGAWKRLGYGRLEMYQWLSGPAYSQAGILQVRGWEAVWENRGDGEKVYLKR